MALQSQSTSPLAEFAALVRRQLWSILLPFAFVTALGVMVARKLPAGAETEFSIMLGALATMTAAVVNYFFGSSAGSREKTLLLTGVRRGEE